MERKKKKVKKTFSGVSWPKPEKDLALATARLEKKKEEIGDFTRKAYFAKNEGQLRKFEGLKEKINLSLFEFRRLEIEKIKAEVALKHAREFSEYHQRWTSVCASFGGCSK